MFACSREELTTSLNKQGTVPLGMVQTAKALGKNDCVPEFSYATKKSSYKALGKLYKCSISSCVNDLIMPALHSRYEYSLIIMMVISTFMDHLL